MTEIHSMDECKVKGSSINAILRYIQLKWGKPYVESLKLPFNPSEIKVDRYYPYEWVRYLHKKIAEKAQGREEQAFKKMGQDVVNSALEGHIVINYLIKRRSLEKLLEDMDKSSEYINVFDGGIIKEGDRLQVIADQTCEDRSEQMCWITEGALNAMIKSSKKNAVVKHTKCQFHGDEHCVFEVIEQK